MIKADDGQDGRSKDRNGKSGEHSIIKVPIGTIVRNANGKVVGDLDKDGSMFIASRGGAGKIYCEILKWRDFLIDEFGISGGKGNHFFSSNNEKAPEVCEYGARGEDLAYILELKSMAHLGLVSDFYDRISIFLNIYFQMD